VAFGDFGGGSAQHAVASAIQGWIEGGHRVDALVTTGDNVYEAARPPLFEAQLDEPYRRLRASRPIWATLGNHDVAAGFGDAELAHLGLPPLPYVKDLPGARLMFVDANHPDAAQAQWLRDQLTAPGPPFRVAVFHQPAYSCGLHGSTSEVVKQWVPELENNGAALVLNGHDHHYERFLSGSGVTYVVTGGGGRELYPLSPFCKGTPPRQASAVRHHFTSVEVRAHSLTLVAVADDGTVLDQAQLARPS
jgi:3',5'-cyclic AMP phosphodiesterase CpdA